MGDNENQFNHWYQQQYSQHPPNPNTQQGFPPPQGGFNLFTPTTGYGFSHSSMPSPGPFQRFSPSPSSGQFQGFSPSPGPFQQFSTPPGGYSAFDTPPEDNRRFRDINLNDDDDVGEEEEEDEAEAEEEEQEEKPLPPRRRSRASAKAKAKGKKPTKGKTTRGSNYTPDEIVWLTKCYVGIGCDPKRANYQVKTEFWDKIAARFNKYVAPAIRECDAIKSAWTRAKKEIGEFNGCYVQLERENTNGRNDLDLYNMAFDLYFSKYNKKFKWMKTLELLKGVPNYAQPESKTQPKRTKINEAGSYTSNSTSATSTNSTSSVHTRPLSQKSSQKSYNGKGKAVAAASSAKTEASELIGKVVKEMQATNENDGFLTAYKIYTRSVTDLDPDQLEKHNKVCAMLAKKWNFEWL